MVSDSVLRCDTPDSECSTECAQAVEVSLNSESYSTDSVLFTYHAASVSSLSVVSGPVLGGTVLTISSGAAHNPVEAWSHYCASKAAANMLTQCLHHEEGGNGIRAIGLSPGTVATDMQRDIKDSGVNPVSQLDWDVHIPADWPARTLLWMCGPEADRFLGDEISLRDEGIRKAVGLI